MAKPSRSSLADQLAIMAGNANPALAKAICQHLKIPLTDSLVSRFSEGEVRLKINENVRGKDVFVVQPTCPPVNDNLMELLIIIDALRRASARRITAVIPYYGYARQDRKDQPRVPITAKLVANLITTAGAHRVLTMDLHAGQIQGFFDIPLDHLYAVTVFEQYLRRKHLKSIVVVSPDVGGIKMARAYAKRLQAGLAIVDKRRDSPESTEVMHILGEVKGKTCLLVDDLIATGSSLVEAASALERSGAMAVYACVTHPILSGPARQRIAESSLKELIVTDTIPLTAERRHPKITVLSVASLLGEAIQRIHYEQSISSLFDGMMG
ncbi:MAG: phosphoribosylpyrophosphate synthetase [Candidatus Omnitrophica bacterium CG11_big_fil_rev_8_21_14_0_20_63_9]|nr:MAG: phosphoribosylpyrophosphate synthetase [Candidatus Omnitrophica bacterium CG11_big_fil_rev_8_21_14_0_20_63_9]